MLAVVGGLVVGRLPDRPRSGCRRASAIGRSSPTFASASTTVMRSPLMRLVAIAYVLLAILGFSVTYPFLLAASETFTTEAELATALGVLSAAVTATSFVVSLVLANRVYARFGVAGAALLLPIVYLGGFGLWLVAFSFSTAALFRFTQQVTQRGVSNAAWSAFYNVVPRERRAQVLAFNDGVPGQVGTILSGFLLLAAGRSWRSTRSSGSASITAVVVHDRRGRHPATLSRERPRRACGPASASRSSRAGPGSAAPRPRPGRAATRSSRPSRRPNPASGGWPRRCSPGRTIERAGPALDPGRRRRPRSRRAGGRARWARDAGWPAERGRRGDGMPARRRRPGPCARPLGPWRRWASMPRRSRRRPWIDGLADDPSPAVRGGTRLPLQLARAGPAVDQIVDGLLAARATRNDSPGSKPTVGWAARYRSTR